MSTYLLEPTDVLFFRDGRPMTGSQCGNGAAWPLPHTLNSAWHAALHRAEWPDIQPHRHRAGRAGKVWSEDRANDGYKFGSLVTAGPFPVRCDSPDGERWHFPRPLDIVGDTAPTLAPCAALAAMPSSLPAPLRFPVVSTAAPDKAKPAPWLAASAYARYLAAKSGTLKQDENDDSRDARDVELVSDHDLMDTEHAIGIGIDPQTGTQDKESFYTAQYLRLRSGWRLGCVAECPDKAIGHADLLAHLVPGTGRMVIGGQQRVCTISRVSRDGAVLPIGRSDGFTEAVIDGKPAWLVKWVLLTPAIFPQIKADDTRGIRAHTGGWLPNWICPETGAVLLRDVDRERRKGEDRAAWRARVRRECPAPAARLVAALIDKPRTITGWGLAERKHGDGKPAQDAGARSSHRAVLAGSIYYFAADSAADAARLARILNWHDPDNHAIIRNRRSTLLGEKGFGLGVCASWNFR